MEFDSDKRGFLCARGPVGTGFADPFKEEFACGGNWLLALSAGDWECVRGEKAFERPFANTVA